MCIILCKYFVSVHFYCNIVEEFIIMVAAIPQLITGSNITYNVALSDYGNSNIS